MYEVRSDDKGQWILYQVGGGDWDVIAWFTTKEDADFAAAAFRARRTSVNGSRTKTAEPQGHAAIASV